MIEEPQPTDVQDGQPEIEETAEQKEEKLEATCDDANAEMEGEVNEEDKKEPGEDELNPDLEGLEETKEELLHQIDPDANEDINEQLGEELPLSDIEEFARKTSSSSEMEDMQEPDLQLEQIAQSCSE